MRLRRRSIPTQNLFQNIVPDLRAISRKTNSQEPTCNRQEGNKEFVKKASVEMKSSVTENEVLKGKDKVR